MRLIIFLLSSFLLIPTSTTAFAQSKSGAEVAQAVLDHLGGSAPWAQAQSARIMEVHISQWARLPYTHEVWIDFTAPRVLVRIRNQDMRQLRAMNGDSGWWIRGGNLTDYEPDFLKDEFKRWRASPYRILHLMALQEPTLDYQMLDDRTLQIALKGEPILRFALNENYQPIGFSKYNDNFETLTMLEPLEEFGEVRLWKEAHLPDATQFRSLNLELELSPVPPAVSFSPPADMER